MFRMSKSDSAFLLFLLILLGFTELFKNKKFWGIMLFIAFISTLVFVK